MHPEPTTPFPPPKYLKSFRLSPSLSFFPSFSKSHPRILSKPLTFSNLGLSLWLILKHLQGPYKSVIFTSYQERKNLRRSADMDDNIDHQKSAYQLPLALDQNGQVF